MLLSMLQFFRGAIGFWVAIVWTIKLVHYAFGYLFPHKMGWSYFQDTLGAWAELRKHMSRLDEATGVRWSTDDIAEAQKKKF